MTPNNRNLGRGRFYSAVSVMQWFILSGREKQQKETFCDLPVRAAKCSVCDVGGKECSFRLRDHTYAPGWTWPLPGCVAAGESLHLSECVCLLKKANVMIRIYRVGVWIM